MANAEKEAINIMIDQALVKFNHSSPAVRTAVRQVYNFKGILEGDSVLGEPERERMMAYVDQAEELASQEFEHLYRQGAKDCVKALRKLGVIK